MIDKAENPTAAQMRGARALLGWSLLEAARRSAQSVSAIRMSEDAASAATVCSRVPAIRRTYEAAGVTFLPADGFGPGVRVAGRDG